MAFSFKAIGTSINAGNAADGYGRYHAIGGWWHLSLLQPELVSHRPAISMFNTINTLNLQDRLKYLKIYSSENHKIMVDIENDVADIGVYLEVDAERLKIVRPCELRRHHSEDSLLSVPLLGD